MEVVIFDMDGVLFDSEPIRLRCWKKLFNKHQINISTDDIKPYVGKPDLVMLMDFNQKGLLSGIPDLMENFWSDYKQIISIDGLPEIRGVRRFLELLRPQKTLALATNSSPVVYNHILSQSGFISYFDIIRGLEGERQPKPSPDIYLSILDALNVEPDVCIAFEDSPSGVVAAHKAGIRNVIAVTSGKTEQLESLGVERYISDFDDQLLKEYSI